MTKIVTKDHQKVHMKKQLKEQMIKEANLKLFGTIVGKIEDLECEIQKHKSNQVTLSYNLTDDKESFEDAYNGWKYKCVIEEIFNKLRSLEKYDNRDSVSIDDIRKIIVEIQRGYDL